MTNLVYVQPGDPMDGRLVSLSKCSDSGDRYDRIPGCAHSRSYRFGMRLRPLKLVALATVRQACNTRDAPPEQGAQKNIVVRADVASHAGPSEQPATKRRRCPSASIRSATGPSAWAGLPGRCEPVLHFMVHRSRALPSDLSLTASSAGSLVARVASQVQP